MGSNSPALALRTKLSLVQVSRAWRKAALHTLYQHVIVRSPSRARLLLAVLEEKAEERSGGYGQWTRHIDIHTYMRGSDDIRYLQTVFRILRCCPNLRTLSGTWIHPLPQEFLNAITTLYGPSLSGLYWNERGPHAERRSTNVTPEFLGGFQNLRVLDLRHFVGADPSERTISTRPLLPNVQELVLSTLPRSLATAAILKLPALQKLTLRTPSFDRQSEIHLLKFLEVHGPSLTLVDLPSPSLDCDNDYGITPSQNKATHVNPDIFLHPDRCPNLESIVFPVTSPQLSRHEHNTLRRIGLRGVRLDGLYPDKQSSSKDHLMAIKATGYPNLELIQTVGFFVGVETDNLAKDVFIWWVEKFEKQGIDFLDGEGVLWAYTEPVEPPPSEDASKDGQVAKLDQLLKTDAVTTPLLENVKEV